MKDHLNVTKEHIFFKTFFFFLLVENITLKYKQTLQPRRQELNEFGVR